MPWLSLAMPLPVPALVVTKPSLDSAQWKQQPLSSPSPELNENAAPGSLGKGTAVWAQGRAVGLSLSPAECESCLNGP